VQRCVFQGSLNGENREILQCLHSKQPVLCLHRGRFIRPQGRHVASTGVKLDARFSTVQIDLKVKAKPDKH